MVHAAAEHASGRGKGPIGVGPYVAEKERLEKTLEKGVGEVGLVVKSGALEKIEVRIGKSRRRI